MESSMIYFQDQEHHDSNPSSTCICSGGSSKRRSLSSSSLSPVQPNPKRKKPIIPLHPSPRGFTKLPLPATSVAMSPKFPPLRRCTSVPVPFMAENAPVLFDVATPSPVNMGTSAKGLCRSVSAPEKDLVNSVGSIGESPDSKRLKRMKERMREISRWCDQVIAEGDEEGEDHLVGAEVVNNEAPKDDEIESRESEEEAVSVEKSGESLIVHLRCPCSKAYQFLLSGNNCYYKIM